MLGGGEEIFANIAKTVNQKIAAIAKKVALVFAIGHKESGPPFVMRSEPPRRQKKLELLTNLRLTQNGLNV